MPEEALELKKNLRCDMKARRNALTDEEKKHAAANCLSKLKELPEFMNADRIYAYIACRNELETADIISWCLSYGKHVAVPKVQGEIMHFYEITALSIVETSVELAPDPSFLLYGNLYFTTVERVHLLFLAERSFFSFSNSASIVYT